MSSIISTKTKAIHYHGTVKIVAGESCKWETSSGRTSTLQITNLDKTNELSLKISGAPNAINAQENGLGNNELNGTWTLSVRGNLTSAGDFDGQTVTIDNTTSKSNPADAHIEVRLI